MINTIEQAGRAQMVAFLPDAIAKAITSYKWFSESEIENEAKKFKDHHDACKVAIAHIELLLKLARSVDENDKTDNFSRNDQAVLTGMVEEAEKTLKNYNARFSKDINGDCDE